MTNVSDSAAPARSRRGLTHALFHVPLLTVIVALGAVGGTETDIWGHLRFGLDILHARAIPFADSYAFTSVAPWINHEWASEVLFAAAYTIAGLVGLTLIKVACATATVYLLDRRLRAVYWAWRDLALLAVTVGLIPLTFSMRPQILSLPLYTLTLTILLEPRARWWLPAVFAFWANLHGGWLIGYGAVVVYAALHPGRRSIFIAAACLLATLANPYGIHLWLALLDATRRGWGDVAEWQPVWISGVQASLLWLATTAAAAAAWRMRRPADRFFWIWTLIVASASLRVARHGGFYALTVAMLAPPLPAPDRRRERGAWRLGEVVLGAYASVVVLVLSGAILWPTFTCMPPQDSRPEIRPEASATRFIRSERLTGRMLTWFNWGEYAIWQVGDLVKVSMDNRRETVYDATTIDRHRQFYDGKRPDYPDEIMADYVWIERASPAVAQLEARGWFVHFLGPRSAILGRMFRPVIEGEADAGTSCFPQP